MNRFKATMAMLGIISLLAMALIIWPLSPDVVVNTILVVSAVLGFFVACLLARILRTCCRGIRSGMGGVDETS